MTDSVAMSEVLKLLISGNDLKSSCEKHGLNHRTAARMFLEQGTDISIIRYENHSKKLKYRVKRSHDQYVAHANGVGLDVLEQYIGTCHKIKHRCQKCEHEWAVKPDNVLYKQSGCPVCATKLKANNRRLTQTEFDLRVSVSVPTIKVIDTYDGEKVKLSCLCEVCGHNWKKNPRDLLNGSGCPKCVKQVYGKRVITDEHTFDSVFEHMCYKELLVYFDIKDITFGKRYENSNYTCDFYINKMDLYIEVSTFNNSAYFERIYKKRKMVENFIFISHIKQIGEFFNDMEII